MVKGRISLVLQFLIAENVFFVVAIFTKVKNDCHKLKKIWNSRWNKILILKTSVQKKTFFLCSLRETVIIISKELPFKESHN